MGRAKISLLGLVTAVVLLGVGATSATATTPVWAECAKAEPKDTGNYSNSTCSEASEPGKGKYELVEGVGKGKAFKGKGGHLTWHIVIPGKGDFEAECSSFTEEGRYALPNKVSDVVMTLNGCKTGGDFCQSGAERETIVTDTLSGELGYLSRTGPTVGLDLANEATPGSGLIADYECVGLSKIRWSGSVIGQQTGDVNLVSKDFEDVYSVGPYLGEVSPGYTPLINQPSFEGGSPDYMRAEFNGPETGKWEPEGGLPMGIEGSVGNKGEALMVKA